MSRTKSAVRRARRNARPAVIAQVHRDGTHAGEVTQHGGPVLERAHRSVHEQHVGPVAAVIADGELDAVVCGDDEVGSCATGYRWSLHALGEDT